MSGPRVIASQREVCRCNKEGVTLYQIKKIFIFYLFMAALGLHCWELGQLSSRNARAAHCGGFSLLSTDSRVHGLQ